MSNTWDLWRDFLYASSHILAETETQLHSDTGLSLSDYDILATLSAAPEQTLTMKALSSTVLVKTSGLSRCVGRLENRHLIVKRPGAEDRRVMEVTLTNDGRAVLKDAAKHHIPFVQRRIIDRLEQLSEQEQQALARALHLLRE